MEKEELYIRAIARAVHSTAALIAAVADTTGFDRQEAMQLCIATLITMSTDCRQYKLTDKGRKLGEAMLAAVEEEYHGS